MKILHCGDIHFRNDLTAEIGKCTDFLVEQAAREGVDLSIVTGDLFDERLHYDSVAFQSAIGFLIKLSHVSPLFILKGTTAHDGTSLKFLEAVNTRHNLHVAEHVGITAYADKFIEIEPHNLPELNNKEKCPRALIFSLPPVSKAHLLAYGRKDIEESRLDTIDTIRSVLQMFRTASEEARALGIPTILTGHLTVTGSSLSTGQQMVGREIELGVGDLRMADADLVCLGHIHKAQSWGDIFYAGSITRLNFGEEEKKGFWIHEMAHRRLSSSRFIETPARVMVTVDYDGVPDVRSLNLPEHSCVRIRYTVAEEDVHTIDEHTLKEEALKRASEVRIEKTVVPKQRVRAEGISLLTSHEQKFRKWAETTGTEISDSVLGKLHQLENENQIQDKKAALSVA